MKLGLRLAFLLIALLLLLQIVSVSAQESGYTYIVQPGDSWPLVAQRVGLTVSQLQEANPDSVRPNGWLIVGEESFCPMDSGRRGGVLHRPAGVKAGSQWPRSSACRLNCCRGRIPIQYVRTKHCSLGNGC